MGIVKLLECTSGAEGGASKRVCEARIRIEALLSRLRQRRIDWFALSAAPNRFAPHRLIAYPQIKALAASRRAQNSRFGA